MAGVNPTCFIFDFDGTLAHSETAYTTAFHYAVRLHTNHNLSQDDFRGFWNATPHEVLARYGEEMLDEMLASFEEHYYANHHHHLVAYEGIVEVLQHLTRCESRIAIVSLKPRRAGEIELDLTGLRPFIDLTVWGDDVEWPKPSPEGVLMAMNELGAQPHQTLVVGDSPADIAMGRAARTRTAAALWSGIDRDRLILESPDFILDSPLQLFDILPVIDPPLA